MPDCRDWYAWHDHMPGSAPTLYVTGTCTFNTSGYSAELKKSEPQGTNEKDLLMELVVHEPSPGDPVMEVITDVPVRYSEDTDVEYDTVTITNADVTIPVQETS
jgi:hypothetical protein